MLGGYRFRLYPDREQERILLRWIGCQRLIYNAKVQEDRYYRKFQRRLVALVGMPVPLDQEYSRFITERTAFLREVPSQVLRNGAALWRQAYARFFAGLGGRPKYQTKAGRQAVWLTSELFEFVPKTDPRTGVVRYRLRIGTTRFPVGEVSYRAHRPHGIPASIHICVEGGQWFVSFAAEDPAVPGGKPENAAERIAEDLRHLSEGQLLERTLGADRGVAKPLMTSDGRVLDLSAVQKERIGKARRRRKTWQRRAARRGKGSRNQKKAYRRAGRYARYEANVRQDYAHKTSHALVVDDRYDLYAFEDLRIGNMTRKPKARQDENGRWLPNGARAKAGLNRAILASAWGQMVSFTRYKALRAGKLVVVVPSAYSSQECAACGHTHPDNRPSQAEFVCHACGHRDNADHNASVVIARRGARKLLSGEPLAPEGKSVKMFRKLGPERSEVTPGEIAEDAGGRRLPARRSASQETPGGDPGNPRLKPHGLGGGRVHRSWSWHRC